MAAELLPTNPAHVDTLDFHLLERAIYELDYELNNRPDDVETPLRGIPRTVDAASGCDRGSLKVRTLLLRGIISGSRQRNLPLSTSSWLRWAIV